MNTQQLLKYTTTIIKKEVYGQIRISDLESCFNVNQDRYFDSLKPILEKDLETQSRLSPFAKVLTLPITNGFGNININGDFYYGPVAGGVSAWTECNGEKGRAYPVDWLNDSEWNDATVSLIQPPTHEFPIARFGAPYGKDSFGWIEVMPRSINYVQFKYFRRPKDIVIGGTYNGAVFVPDPNASNNVDPEWNDTDVYRLIGMTILDLGMPLDDDAVKQAGALKAGGSL